MNQIHPSKGALFAMELLQAHGYEAYAVGGCVRDSILGRIPDDWDITTSALPEETKELFKSEKIIDTGIKHGTVSTPTALPYSRPFSKVATQLTVSFESI